MGVPFCLCATHWCSLPGCRVATERTMFRRFSTSPIIMDAGYIINERQPTKLGKLVKHNIITGTRFLSQDLLAITCLLSIVIILLHRFSSIHLPFTHDSCYFCLMILWVLLMHLEGRNVQRRMALEAEDAPSYEYVVLRWK